MNGYLLDTSVISMLAPSLAMASPQFLAWLDRADAESKVFLPAVTIHEIEKGIALLDHKGAVSKAAILRVWLQGLVSAYADRILAVDLRAAALGGQLEAQAMAAGHAAQMADAAIAGIARQHDLTIVTRNVAQFAPFGVAVVSPEGVLP